MDLPRHPEARFLREEGIIEGKVVIVGKDSLCLWVVLFVGRVVRLRNGDIYAISFSLLGEVGVGLFVLLDQKLGSGDVEVDLSGGFGDPHLILKNLTQKLLSFLHKHPDTYRVTLLYGRFTELLDCSSSE